MKGGMGALSDDDVRAIKIKQGRPPYGGRDENHG